MRRKTTKPGTVSRALRFFALAISAMFLAGSALAQIETQPSWAILEFANKGEQALPVGKMATDAISNELTRQARVEVIAAETVSRTVADMGFQPPVNKPTEIQRLGQELQASSIVTGEVLNWRVVTKPEGKQAQVLMKVLVWDVASGLTVNGAALSANSDVRSGDISNEDLIKDALSQGSFEILSEINARTLPSGTILNTLNNRALINKGSRSGFSKDMRVVVTRGKNQVAEGIVRDVDPDSSFIETTRSFRGIQPGDKVRIVFDAPDIKSTWAKDGTSQVRRNKSSGNNSGLVSLVIVLLILGFLLTGGHGSNQAGVGGVTAEAAMLPNDVPAVRISWTRDSFFRGTNQGVFQYQIWREGSGAVPAAIASKTESFTYNDVNNSYGGTWYNFNGIIGGNTCDNEEPPADDTPAGLAVIAGTPYRYSVEVVYSVNCLDLPNACTGGGTGGTTGGTGGTTTGGTTGTTTGGTTTGGTTGTTGNLCYFVTERVVSGGQATPLIRPTLREPADNAIVGNPRLFSFTSVRGPITSVPLEYVVQFSDRQDFVANRTFTTEPFVELVLPGGQTVSSPTIDTSTIFPAASVLYWRVGARNPEDSPGPVRDSSGQRYIFSAKRHFRRPNNP